MKMADRREVIVFDIDKTLIHQNLHELLIDLWSAETPRRRLITRFVAGFRRACLFPFIQRRLEYLATAFISEQQLHELTLRILSGSEHVHSDLVRRIGKYKRYRYQVVLVSATPERVARPLARQLGASVYASKCICGVLTRDLLAKKRSVYLLMEKDALAVRTVYSDSHLDFWDRSNSFLVKDKIVTKVIA